jgi:nucleoside-diphosphate-sugar epimerase
MIIGSGLLARTFAPEYSHRDDVCIYAAGVSNSNCKDAHEFERERQRLLAALKQAGRDTTFVYFGTCSVADPEACDTPYVQHKLAMEHLVSKHPRYLILRLPQVAGKTPNPHTLLNYLYARISRSESFNLWRNARRNIIDVDDVFAIARELLNDDKMRNVAVNIANPVSYSMPDIIQAVEYAVGKTAIYEIAERGSGYPINIDVIRPILDRIAVRFDEGYLKRLSRKYYGNAERND